MGKVSLYTNLVSLQLQIGLFFCFILTVENLGLSSCLTNKSTLVYLQQLHLMNYIYFFCFEGTFTPGDVFKPNHFVPIVFGATVRKRKLSKAVSKQNSK